MADRCLDHPTEFFSLQVGDGGFEVLNLAKVLTHKGHQCHLSDSSNPGIADQLRVKSERLSSNCTPWQTFAPSCPMGMLEPGLLVFRPFRK
jgi:hypothetical protein